MQEMNDTINLVSLIIGMLNLEENLTQGDKQELLQEFNQKAEKHFNFD